MKRVVFSVLLSLLLVGVGYVCAQTPAKFAHIDSHALLTSLPKYDTIMKQLKAFEQELMDQMEQLQVEYNKKLQDYRQKSEGLTPALREAKERELTDLAQRANVFQQAAQSDLQTQQGKLLQPLIDEVNAAIQRVGTANGYTYVFDKGAGFLLYVSPASEDILEKVQKELKVK